MIHNDPTTTHNKRNHLEDQYQVYHGFILVPRASARASWKMRKGCGLEAILLITLMIKILKISNI